MFLVVIGYPITVIHTSIITISTFIKLIIIIIIIIPTPIIIICTPIIIRLLLLKLVIFSKEFIIEINLNPLILIPIQRKVFSSPLPLQRSFAVILRQVEQTT